MSFQSTWRRFISFLRQHEATDNFQPMDNAFQSDNAYTWDGPEKDAAQQTLDVNQGNLKVLLTAYTDRYAAWLDSKMGGAAPPEKIVSNSPELDGWLITGGIVAAVIFIFKKLF